MQRRESEFHLRLHPLEANHGEVLGGVRRRIQENGFADAGLSTQNQRATETFPNAPQKIIEYVQFLFPTHEYH